MKINMPAVMAAACALALGLGPASARAYGANEDLAALAAQGDDLAARYKEATRQTDLLRKEMSLKAATGRFLDCRSSYWQIGKKEISYTRLSDVHPESRGVYPGESVGESRWGNFLVDIGPMHLSRDHVEFTISGAEEDAPKFEISLAPSLSPKGLYEIYLLIRLVRKTKKNLSIKDRQEQSGSQQSEYYAGSHGFQFRPDPNQVLDYSLDYRQEGAVRFYLFCRVK